MNKLIVPLFLLFTISPAVGSDYSLAGHILLSTDTRHIATDKYQIEGRIDQPDKCEVASANYKLEGFIVAENSINSTGHEIIQSSSKEDTERPVTYSLLQSYPNPFNTLTTIKYGLPRPADVMIDIFDVMGRKVESISKGVQPAGYHTISWDAGDNSSGIYFYILQAGEFTDTKKMILLK